MWVTFILFVLIMIVFKLHSFLELDLKFSIILLLCQVYYQGSSVSKTKMADTVWTMTPLHSQKVVFGVVICGGGELMVGQSRDACVRAHWLGNCLAVCGNGFFCCAEISSFNWTVFYSFCFIKCVKCIFFFTRWSLIKLYPGVLRMLSFIKFWF